MNQGNAQGFIGDDGVYQDGCLLIHFPDQHNWIGIFLKFQSQSWHTDDHTGHRIDVTTDGTTTSLSSAYGHCPSPQNTDSAVRIIAAMVNPTASPETESVTLLNVTDTPLDLAGWKLLDRDKNAMPLTGIIQPGETEKITLQPPVVLPNKGGIITLQNADNLRVDGVSYTEAQASKPGYSLKF